MVSYYQTNSSADLGNVDSESPIYERYQKFEVGSKILFDAESAVDLWVLCNHSRPVKWVANDEYVRQIIASLLLL
jgi:hypothetical protein